MDKTIPESVLWDAISALERAEHHVTHKQRSDAAMALRVAIHRSEAAAALKGTVRVPVEPWQPIETAPKDGTRLLVFDPDVGRIVAGAGWDNDTPAQIRWEVMNDICVCPTHWMPLPAAPKEPKHG